MIQKLSEKRLKNELKSGKKMIEKRVKSGRKFDQMRNEKMVGKSRKK